MITAQLDGLIYEVTSRFDSSITPAEARALIPTPDESRDLDWLLDVLGDVDIEHEVIEDLSAINLERFHGVGVCIDLEDQFFVFYFDDVKQFIQIKRVGDVEPQPISDFLRLQPAVSFKKVLRFYERSSEAYAVIPGIERHWFLSSIWENRKYLLQASLASLLTNLFAVGTSLFAMIVYNRIIPANAMSSLTVLVVGMIFLLVADYLIKTIRAKLLGLAGVESDLIIADRLFTKVIDMQYRSKKGSVGTLANTLKEYEQIREFFTSATLVSVIDMPFAIIFLGFIWFLGGAMVIPVFLGIGVLILVTLYMQPRMKKISEQALEDAHNKHSVLVETLSGLETVKLLGAGGILRRRFRNVLAKQAQITEESKKYIHFSTNITQEVQQAVQIGVVAVGALIVSTGEFGFGAIIACTILSGKALLPFAQLAQLLSRFNQILTGYKSLDNLMKQPSEHQDGQQYLTRGRYKGDIELKEVSFSYPGQETKALDNISFKIKAGERVAIVGRVGSGKTTIGKLLCKLFVPDTGSVLIDGVDILQLDPAEVRENFGVVSQEPWLVAGTIEQNILLGSSQATTEDLLWAGELAGVSRFIDKHPKGYKLEVSERGEGLSGGQRQAITIARSIVKRPPIYLLDEPTSAMDARSERQLIDSFKAADLNATLVVITHRTSLLALVDRVIVIDQGRVAGEGSVEAFLRAGLKKTDASSPSKSDDIRNEVAQAN